MASSGSFSFGCSAAVPLLPTPSFSFPSQPAASSFPFTNDPAPTPCRHALPPHLVRFPRPLCLLGSPLCCPALLPEKLFPRPLCLLGLPLCGPALLPKKLFPGPCALCGPACGCLSLGPCAWWVCPCAPRRSSGRSFLSRSYFGPSCRGLSPCQLGASRSLSQRFLAAALQSTSFCHWLSPPFASSYCHLTFPWEAPASAPIFAQHTIELQAVPSIQSLQPPSPTGTLGPSAAELLDEDSRAQQPSASLTFWRGSLRSSSFESLPLPPCVRAPYGTH